MGWIVGRRSLIAILLLAALLGGCAQVKRQAFNSAAASHVKTVVVAQAENQAEYQAYVLGHPGMSFGLIGGLVAAADMQIKTSKLTAAISAKETRLQERFSEALSARLTKAGYQPVLVVLPKDTKPHEALALARQRASGDAILVVDLYGGYWAAGPQTDYFPRLLVNVKSVDAKSEKILYEDSISYGYAAPQADTVHLASDPVYRFANIDILVADPVKTRQALYVGVEALAEQIVSDLKRN